MFCYMEKLEKPEKNEKKTKKAEKPHWAGFFFNKT